MVSHFHFLVCGRFTSGWVGLWEKLVFSCGFCGCFCLWFFQLVFGLWFAFGFQIVVLPCFSLFSVLFGCKEKKRREKKRKEEKIHLSTWPNSRNWDHASLTLNEPEHDKLMTELSRTKTWKNVGHSPGASRHIGWSRAVQQRSWGQATYGDQLCFEPRNLNPSSWTDRTAFTAATSSLEVEWNTGGPVLGASLNIWPGKPDELDHQFAWA